MNNRCEKWYDILNNTTNITAMFLQLERKARKLFLCYKKPGKNLLSRLKVSGYFKK